MLNAGKEIRLTDELERQLMMKAIEDQYRFKPLVALKKLFTKLSASNSGARTPATSAVESAS